MCRARGEIQGFDQAGSPTSERPDAFTLTGDEPPVLLGSNRAPNAVELVLQALAFCYGVGYVYNAAARGIDIDELRYEIEGDLDLHRFLGLGGPRAGFGAIRAKAWVRSPNASREQLEELCQYVQDTSPVLDILANPVPVTTDLEVIALSASVAAPASRTATEARLLDAAERLLGRVGYAAITTRTLADEAGANPGLVHYYFGSMDNLFVRVLERFTGRLIERQRTMYTDPAVPFIEKWRTAMRYLDADQAYQKVWYELQALAWNRPELRDRVAWVDSQWRAVLTEAFDEPRRRYALDVPLEALVALVITFNEGIILERLSGIETGQQALLDWIDARLTRLESEHGSG